MNRCCPFRITVSLLSLLALTTCGAQAQSPENLDELFSRKGRQASNRFYSGEDSTNAHVWQSQSLCYHDQATGHEVWKLSNLPAASYSRFHNDIKWPTWSADGRRLALLYMMDEGANVTTGSFSGEDGYRVWFTARPDGHLLRPIVNGPQRTDSHHPYFHWSPVEVDTYYAFGRTQADNSGANPNHLYRGVITDQGSSYALHLDFPGTTELYLPKAISGDGVKVLATEWSEDNVYPATIYPTAAIDDPDGYTIDRPHDGTYWGNTPDTITGWHDQQLVMLDSGSKDYWMYFLPSGCNTRWRFQINGSHSDGGSNHTVDHSTPYDFGETIPMNMVGFGNNAWPGTEYWSHATAGRWGRYVVYSSVDVSPVSPGVEDTTTHTVVEHQFNTNGTQHHDWGAFSDRFVSTLGGGQAGSYLNDRLFSIDYTDATSAVTVAYTHNLFNNGGTYLGSAYEYGALSRPAQSPDGTKISFHSTFLVQKTEAYDDKPGIFWAVAHWPHPPELMATTATGGTVSVRVDWRLSTTPRGYTQRGWPNDTTDQPPPPREVSQFRLWRCGDSSGQPDGNWLPVASADHDVFSRYNFSTGAWSGNSYWILTDTPGNGTFHYAVTSLEHSGLESHTLSNTFRIVLSGGNGTGTESTPYPSDPSADSNFFNLLPTMPTGLRSVHCSTGNCSAQYPEPTNAGQYLLEWNASPTSTLIRYYNIYAEDGSSPSVSQENRIASVPADVCDASGCQHVDWLGNPNGSTRYVVTAVDFQSNESGLGSGDTTSPGAPENLRVQ